MCRLLLSMVGRWNSFLLQKVRKTLHITLSPVYYLCIRYSRHVSPYHCGRVICFLPIEVQSPKVQLIVHMAFFCLEVSTDSKSFLINPQCTQDHVEAKVVVAGLSTTCSQKIHNQLVCIISQHFHLSFVTVLESTVVTTMKS